jgi:hypothetical protein
MGNKKPGARPPDRRDGFPWPALATAAFLLAAGTTAVSQPPDDIEFARERISIAVEDTSIMVDGIYVLRNPAPYARHQTLFYPFPVDSTHPYPDSISVWHRKSPVEFGVREDGVAFSVEIPAQGSVGIRVVYRQACPDRSGCYILTTTAAWERPLKSADFIITLAEGLELEWAAYEVFPVANAGGGRRYEFSREDFMPDRDLCLRWKPASTTGTSP